MPLRDRISRTYSSIDYTNPTEFGKLFANFEIRQCFHESVRGGLSEDSKLYISMVLQSIKSLVYVPLKPIVTTTKVKIDFSGTSTSDFISICIYCR